MVGLYNDEFRTAFASPNLDKLEELQDKLSSLMPLDMYNSPTDNFMSIFRKLEDKIFESFQGDFN